MTIAKKASQSPINHKNPSTHKSFDKKHQFVTIRINGSLGADLKEIFMKKILSIALAVASIAQQSSAMQPLAARTAGQLAKHYGKKGFSGMMTALHWNIALGDSFIFAVNRAINSDRDKTLEKLQDASEQATQFVKNELEKTYGIKIDGVKIVPSFDQEHTDMAVYKKHICLAPSTEQKITQALASNNQKMIDELLGQIGHENSHVAHNDRAWKTAADIALPFITHGSVKLISRMLPTANKTSPFLLEQFMKIPTGIAKNKITEMARMAVCRHQELRADNEIVNDIEKLTGFRNTLINFEQKSNQLLNQSKVQRWVNNFFEEHPLPEKRIKKLDQRIALLEQESH